MLPFIDGRRRVVRSHETPPSVIHIYNPAARDYFTHFCIDWYEAKMQAYTIDIDGSLITIPSNYQIVIGDFHGGLDVIKPEEAIGREFDAIVFHKDFVPDSWQLRPMSVVNVSEKTFVTPRSAYPIPLGISENKAILTSERDIYAQLKYLTFGDIA